MYVCVRVFGVRLWIDLDHHTSSFRQGDLLSQLVWYWWLLYCFATLAVVLIGAARVNDMVSSEARWMLPYTTRVHASSRDKVPV